MKGHFNMRLEAWSHYNKKMTWRSDGVVVPLASCDAEIHIRHPEIEGEDALVVSVTTGNIILADVSPNISIGLSPELIADLDFPQSKWRLDITFPGELPDTLIEGDVFVERW